MKVEIAISRKFRYLIMILLVNALFLDNSNGQSLPVVSSGKIIRLESFKSKYVDPRNIDVWLPIINSESKKYQVVICTDGQMLFLTAPIRGINRNGRLMKSWSELITRKEIKECISSWYLE